MSNRKRSPMKRFLSPFILAVGILASSAAYAAEQTVRFTVENMT